MPEATDRELTTWDDLAALGYTLGPPVVESTRSGYRVIRPVLDRNGEQVTIKHDRPNTVGVITGIGEP